MTVLLSLILAMLASLLTVAEAGPAAPSPGVTLLVARGLGGDRVGLLKILASFSQLDFQVQTDKDSVCAEN